MTIRIRLMTWIAAVLVLLAAGSPFAASWPADWEAVANDPAAVERVRDAIAMERLRGGYADMTPLALSLVEASRVQTSSQRSAALAELAVAAAPGDARVRFWNMRVCAFSTKEFGKAVGEGWAALSAVFSDPWVQSIAVARLAEVVCLAGLLVGLALLIASFPSVFPQALHDYRDRFPEKLRRFTPIACLLIGLVTVAFFGIGPLVLLLPILFVLMLYLPKRVRLTIGVAFALAIFFFPALSLIAHLEGVAGARAWSLYRVWKGDAGDDLASQIETSFAADDPVGLVARARLARRSGDLAKTSDLLEKASKVGGDSGVIAFEIGNVHFLRGQLEEAVDAYALAVQQRPDDWLVWFNKSVAHLARLELSQADEAMATARGIDDGAVESHQVASSDVKAGLLPSSSRLPDSWIIDELIYAELAPGWSQNFWELAGARVAPVKPLYVALCVLLMTLLSMALRPKGLSHRCLSCGTVICPRCDRAVKDGDVCVGCMALTRQSGADAAGRQRMREAVDRWARNARRAKRVGATLLPGWTLFVYRGEVTAFFAGLVWALALAVVLLSLALPLPVLHWSWARPAWVALGVFGLTYVWGFRSAR
jgi:tetratricopeptide (TPR) repeat protein